ncbi:hypothetical protein J6590_037646, partial [Homalodisca vitripennis]
HVKDSQRNEHDQGTNTSKEEKYLIASPPKTGDRKNQQQQSVKTERGFTLPGTVTLSRLSDHFSRH